MTLLEETTERATVCRRPSAFFLLNIVAVAVLLAATASAQIQTINFDSLASGVQITNQFAAQGVIFSGGTNTNNDTLGGALIIPSPPNYAMITSVIAGETIFTFKAGAADAVTNSFTLTQLGLNTGTGCLDGVTANYFDIHGVLITSQIIPPVGPNQSQAPTQVGVTNLPGIHSVQLVADTQNSGCGVAENFAFDGVTYNTPVVPAPPSIVKAFSPSTIPAGGTSTLTFTITNPTGVGAVTLTGVGFMDTLPAGVVVATPNGLTGSCGGGAITATAGSGTVSLSGASLAPATSCTFSVNVVGSTLGTKTNSVTVTSTEGGNGNTSTVALNVVAPPAISKAFTDSQIQLLGPSNTTGLTFTITNPNSFDSLTGVAFTDTLPSGLLVASPNNLQGACGGGTITAIAGSNSISLSNATLAASASCTFSVDVSGVAIGTQVNTTGAVTAFGGTIIGNTATATVNVDMTFFYWFFAESGGGNGH